MQTIQSDPKEWQRVGEGDGKIQLVRQRYTGKGVTIAASTNDWYGLTESEAVTLTAWLIQHGYNRVA